MESKEISKKENQSADKSFKFQNVISYLIGGFFSSAVAVFITVLIPVLYSLSNGKFSVFGVTTLGVLSIIFISGLIAGLYLKNLSNKFRITMGILAYLMSFVFLAKSMYAGAYDFACFIPLTGCENDAVFYFILSVILSPLYIILASLIASISYYVGAKFNP